MTLWQAPITSGDSDGFFEALDPPTGWCAIQPIEMAVSDERRIQISRVMMRFHPQVTIDTRLVYSDPVLNRDRELFVKIVQNVDDANCSMVLACEEVWP